MKIIGLMGNSGSGKSTVAKYLRQKGAYVIDADQISHDVCEVGQEGLAAVKEQFDGYFFNEDGSLNRRRLGRHVFANKKELEKLEGILHPIINKKVDEMLKNTKDELIIVDCALLVKTGLYKLAHEVWLVKADVDTKINRICARDNIPMEQALQRLRNQYSEDILVRYSHKIILNDGSAEMLYAQIEDLLNETK